MAELVALGLAADWLNAWLAAVGSWVTTTIVWPNSSAARRMNASSSADDWESS